jgi:hypothetical protein
MKINNSATPKGVTYKLPQKSVVSKRGSSLIPV